jgi:hypothetical protein
MRHITRATALTEGDEILQADPANSIRGSAARRRQQQQGQPPPAHQQQSAPRVAAPPTSCRQQQDLWPIEVCADCGQRFDTVRGAVR